MKVHAHKDGVDFVGCNANIAWGAKNIEFNVMKGIKRFWIKGASTGGYFYTLMEDRNIINVALETKI